MTLYLAALLLFLAAFAGLAAGLLLKRRGLRGGCSPGPDSGRDCHCQSAAGSGAPPPRAVDGHDCESCPSSPPPGGGPPPAGRSAVP